VLEGLESAISKKFGMDFVFSNNIKSPLVLLGIQPDQFKGEFRFLYAACAFVVYHALAPLAPLGPGFQIRIKQEIAVFMSKLPKKKMQRILSVAYAQLWAQGPQQAARASQEAQPRHLQGRHWSKEAGQRSGRRSSSGSSSGSSSSSSSGSSYSSDSSSDSNTKSSLHKGSGFAVAKLAIPQSPEVSPKATCGIVSSGLRAPPRDLSLSKNLNDINDECNPRAFETPGPEEIRVGKTEAQMSSQADLHDCDSLQSSSELVDMGCSTLKSCSCNSTWDVA
jgi:hypothetical protein